MYVITIINGKGRQLLYRSVGWHGNYNKADTHLNSSLQINIPIFFIKVEIYGWFVCVAASVP